MTQHDVEVSASALISMDAETLLRRREQVFGQDTPLFYDDPVHLVKGSGVWLYDADGKKYLDCYNNVPSVGHCHPRVVEALAKQAATLNVHSRYLDEIVVEYGELLLSKFDSTLNRLSLCCTGSEANELALRIAKLNTGGVGFICTNATYHGNTAAVSQLSSMFSPFEGRGNHIRMVSWPDAYRAKGGLSGDALADAYADEVAAAIASFSDEGIPFAGMLVCPIFANEGLPTLLPRYLQRAAQQVRAANGLLIADEVQSGFARTGVWWGHMLSDVIPDIVTLGKPMGAGHPVSGVVARADLIDNFRREEMYFNTFAGNPVSGAVAKAVINVIDDEGLADNAADVGGYILQQLKALKEIHEWVGDVRGQGLFFGIDLVTDRETKSPAPEQARIVVNWMRHHGVLMSKIGEYDNVLKIRPPLCFSKDNADQLIATLDKALVAL